MNEDLSAIQIRVGELIILGLRSPRALSELSNGRSVRLDETFDARMAGFEAGFDLRVDILISLQKEPVTVPGYARPPRPSAPAAIEEVAAEVVVELKESVFTMLGHHRDRPLVSPSRFHSSFGSESIGMQNAAPWLVFEVDLQLNKWRGR